MANVIKSSTTIQPNTIATYPFVIGVNQGGYGSTSSTYYYNGKTPNVGGYVVYKDNGISSPPFYIMNNDADLVEFVASIGGGYSNIGDALNYLRNSGTYKCVNFDYPNIVTSGLTRNLDAGYVSSYPRVYTTWNDMSGNYGTATLYNSPTYNSSYYGGIVLDGIDDYVRGPLTAFGTNTPWTMSCIFKAGTQTNYNGIIALGYIPVITMSTAGDLFMFWYNGSGYPGITTSGTNYADNQPHNVTATFDGTTVKLYVDSILKVSSVSSVQALWGDLTLGMEYNNGPKCLNGTIYNGLVYNRALSSDEVLQNYYAGLQRLIKTSNLFMWYDARNTDKQVITPTIANDMGGTYVGYPNNGKLYNGTSLNHRDGGISFSFDGIDDFIDMSTGIGVGNYTICFWSKRELEGRMPISSRGTSYFYWYGDYSWKYRHGGVDGEFYYPIVTSIPINTWGFYCVVYDGYNVTIYRQGVYQGQQSTTGTASFGQGLRIGAWSANPSYNYKGLISEVRFYYVALTATEISTMFTATKSRYGL